MKKTSKLDIANKVNNEKGRGDRTKYPPTDYLPNEERIITDPLGSWTGTPVGDISEAPVQDVDDL